MKVILLSGGSGKRLWPLSNEVRAKQFIKLFKDEHGNYESMVQRIYRQIKNIDPNADIIIATSASQVSTIHSQLGDKVDISIEPFKRDTFPAIILAASLLFEKNSNNANEIVTICPVDPFVDEDYFKELFSLSDLISKKQCNVAVMGINPTYASSKYGYIVPSNINKISTVDAFIEKPDDILASELIEKGALWNCGVLVTTIGYILEKAKHITGFSTHQDLLNNYEVLKKTSFDYAILEKERNLKVKRFKGKWEDLGTWNSLVETMEENTYGNVKTGENCSGSYIINELDIPILCTGLKDIIVASSPEGILVSDKKDSANIKSMVESINTQVMFAEKSWGSFKVIDVSEESLTIKVKLKAGHKMNYHSHSRRSETWTIISGEGLVILNGKEQLVKYGDYIYIPVNCKHTIEAQKDLQIIEVQLGLDPKNDDKIIWQY